jgi:DNA-binding response OmpR family regulator
MQDVSFGSCVTSNSQHGFTQYAAIPFVLLTALGDRDSELTGRRLGADDYLTKPTDFEILHTVIENRLRRQTNNARTRSNYHLTDRERKVLTWVGRGKTSSEIVIGSAGAL